MKKMSTLTIAAMSALLLAACTTTVDNTDNDSDSAMSESSSSGPYLEDETSSDDSVDLDVSAGETRVITMSVTDWEFSPSMITAKKGEKVQLKLVGGTGIHSFAIPDLGMNVRVEAGQTVTVDLPTDKIGSFDARCRIPCGPGHMDMKATIIIS
jgi:cytochrome c oxidase subunit 2